MTADQKDALKHAWDWFTVHAGQRMQLINYFLVATAFITASFGAAMSAKNYPVAVCVSALGVVLTLAFMCLEQRTKELVKLAEAPLKAVQKVLAEAAIVPAMELCKEADAKSDAAGKFGSYSKVIKLAHRVVLFVYFLLLIFSFVHLVRLL